MPDLLFEKSIQPEEHQPILKVPDDSLIFKYMKIIAEVILIPILSEGIGYGILFAVAFSDGDHGNNVGPDRKQMAWDEKDFWMVLYGRKKCTRTAFRCLGLSHRGHGPLPFPNHQLSHINLG